MHHFLDLRQAITPITVTSLDGKPLKVEVTDVSTTVSSPQDSISSDISEADIYASNGVIHTISSLLFPPGALAITPEKYLLTLNCSRFVSLLHSVNLTGLVDNTDTQRTILAPSDDLFTLMHGSDELPEEGTIELRRLLRYHFIPGLWTPKNLKDGMLIETELKEVGLDSGRQVMGVEVLGDKEAKSLRFGGAAVIGEPGKCHRMPSPRASFISMIFSQRTSTAHLCISSRRSFTHPRTRLRPYCRISSFRRF